MVVVFFGTPRFALPALKRLMAAHEVKAVVTQPDRPKGRHLRSRPSAVKEWALKHSIPILEPESLQTLTVLRSLREFKPDIIVVAAYGQIIPKEVLELPKHGCLNIHASLLPRYRGAAPIQRALMDDMDKTGVTIMQMDEGMDTGDILDRGEVPIKPEDDMASLSDRLAEVGADLIIQILDKLGDKGWQPIKQDDRLATYARALTKQESLVDWSRPAPEIVNLIRALAPTPGAFTRWRGRRLKIYKGRHVPHETSPGEFYVADETLFIGTGMDAIEVLRLQPEGKKVMGAAEFIRGYRPRSGECVG